MSSIVGLILDRPAKPRSEAEALAGVDFTQAVNEGKALLCFAGCLYSGGGHDSYQAIYKQDPRSHKDPCHENSGSWTFVM
jgi:hypothetical protein